MKSDKKGGIPHDSLKWGELGTKLRNVLKFSKEGRSWFLIMETFAIIFVTSLLPSLFDMGSVALSV